jgi:GT2 family glycosyltransferase
MKFFGMVSTRTSAAYTPYAIKSFLDWTALEKDDRFYLIDNDGGVDAGFSNPAITLIRHPSPLGFAANVNQIMRLAKEHEADLYFLNNDIIFTPHWLEPLAAAGPGICSPASNFHFGYRTRDLVCGKFMDLADYIGHERDLNAIAAEHARRNRQLVRQFMVWFFCIRIPFAVYSVVGELDENFGPGGGEDADYCLRCHLLDIPVCTAGGSFVLHFVGKSTWRDGRPAEDQAARVLALRKVFVDKWGTSLADMALEEKCGVLDTDPALRAAFERGNYRRLIESLRSR